MKSLKNVNIPKVLKTTAIAIFFIELFAVIINFMKVLSYADIETNINAMALISAIIEIFIKSLLLYSFGELIEITQDNRSLLKEIANKNEEIEE